MTTSNHHVSAPESILILDTNVLATLPRSSPLWEILRAINATSTIRVAIPEMCLMELLSRRRREYESVFDNATKAFSALYALQFSPEDGMAHWPAVAGSESHTEKWEYLYRDSLDIIPLTRHAAVEALRREADRRRPARSSGKSATGSRDAAIWLTVLEAARDNPSSVIYFASKNSKDFGIGGGLHPELASEVEAAGGRVEYVEKLEHALAKVSTREECRLTAEQLLARLQDASCIQEILRYIDNSYDQSFVHAAAVGITDDGVAFYWTPKVSLSVEDIEVIACSDEISYSIRPSEESSGSLIHSVTATVIALGSAIDSVNRWGAGREAIAFAIDVRVIIGPSSVSVASSNEPRRFEPSEESRAAVFFMTSGPDPLLHYR
ncbi:DUF4935 domain-containing protein [Streptomyces lonarensis]|uniref:DUF4935 domain-containing protein n=1 Tax=Streptomyces lonarensis TaxID=700599 RepID=A0A7X6CY38_9ACTN|nr:DUF4935 domain-containing protein [Streptomyces lonarensis]